MTICQFLCKYIFFTLNILNILYKQCKLIFLYINCIIILHIFLFNYINFICVIEHYKFEF